MCAPSCVRFQGLGQYQLAWEYSNLYCTRDVIITSMQLSLCSMCYVPSHVVVLQLLLLLCTVEHYCKAVSCICCTVYHKDRLARKVDSSHVGCCTRFVPLGCLRMPSNGRQSVCVCKAHRTLFQSSLQPSLPGRLCRDHQLAIVLQQEY